LDTTLAKRHPETRILITTFSRKLALRLSWQAKLLLGADSTLFARIRIEHVHKIARDILASKFSDAVTVIQGADVLQLLEDSMRATGQHGPFSLAFLKAEWDSIVEPTGIETWDEYRSASRANRGTPLGARQRLAAWRVFERALALMRQRRVLTWDRVCIEAAKLQHDAPMFDNVIADEYQDLGPAEMRFLRALVRPGCDDLFLCGDSCQRIYKAPCSWLSLGIDIRGRSTNLKVNYRTTEQIRRFCGPDRQVQHRCRSRGAGTANVGFPSERAGARSANGGDRGRGDRNHSGVVDRVA